jgi:hypothetical protein
MPADKRRALLAPDTSYEPASGPPAKQYYAVVVDASAQGRNMMAPIGDVAGVSMMAIGRQFFRSVFLQHRSAKQLVVCYDNAGLLPPIREQVLHLNRYGPRLERAPPAMDTKTHTFVDGRVWSLNDHRLPASAGEVEASTIEWLATTLDKLLASSAGKKRVMMLHCEAVKRVVEVALEDGTLHPDTQVTFVPPVGALHHIVVKGEHRTEARHTQYGEADMLIMAHAALHIATGPVLVRTIDTDALAQAYFYMLNVRGTMDVHIATVNRSAAGEISHKKNKGFSRQREIVDIASLISRVSPATMALVLVYGGDYIKGMCIRGLGLPKAALFDMIQRGADDWLVVADDSVTIDWGVFFGGLARVCKTPKKALDTAGLNVEMQRLAYCIVYFCGLQGTAGGPPVDERDIILPHMSHDNLATCVMQYR